MFVTLHLCRPLAVSLIPFLWESEMLAITVLCELYCTAPACVSVEPQLKWTGSWERSGGHPSRCRHALYSLWLIEWFLAIQHRLTAHRLMENSEGVEQAAYTHTLKPEIRYTHTHKIWLTCANFWIQSDCSALVEDLHDCWDSRNILLYCTHKLKITFYSKRPPRGVTDCTFPTETAKLRLCSLHFIRIVATSTRMCAF